MRTTNWSIIEAYARSVGRGLETARNEVDDCDPAYVEWLENKLEEVTKFLHEATILKPKT